MRLIRSDLITELELEKTVPAHFEHDKTVMEDLGHFGRAINTFLIVHGQVDDS